MPPRWPRQMLPVPILLLLMAGLAATVTVARTSPATSAPAEGPRTLAAGQEGDEPEGLTDLVESVHEIRRLLAAQVDASHEIIGVQTQLVNLARTELTHVQRTVELQAQLVQLAQQLLAEANQLRGTLVSQTERLNTSVLTLHGLAEQLLAESRQLNAKLPLPPLGPTATGP
ncbi:MAG: hypothetical protein M3203_16650 [Actinomycetota bacterium]|nr:hypothetical protein [Actinomycetota bacterium]